jgi:hypothetical protein
MEGIRHGRAWAVALAGVALFAVRRVANDATSACDGDQPSEPPAGSTSAMSRPRNLPTS